MNATESESSLPDRELKSSGTTYSPTSDPILRFSVRRIGTSTATGTPYREMVISSPAPTLHKRRVM